VIRAPRIWHKWIGGIVGLFILLIAVTGTLLALKHNVGAIRTPTERGTRVETHEGVISIQQVIDAAIAVGRPEIQSVEDIDRIDYRPGRNNFKVQSSEGYWEIQVDGTSGEILSSSFRNDHFIETIHDLSFFTTALRDYWLPVVGVGLTALSLTGYWMILVVWKRQRHARALVAKTKALREDPDA
jgi:uncharacterized iron-regulated membrane protein